MSAHDGQTCEVKVADAWRAVSLADARAHHGYADKRCPACHGRVTVSGTYGSAVKLTLAHRRGHDGCPAQPRTFRGIACPHPQAMV